LPSNIPETEPWRARGHAQQLLARRREHIRTIRKRAIAGSVAAFVAAWTAIGVQLASGHDPALSKSAQPAAAASSSSTNSSTTDSNSSDATTTTDPTQTTSPSESSSQQLAPLTTQQS
jgi:hypothetical protein